MTSFPGENSPVPKRLLEAIPNQPLSYLVPKGNISSLVSSKYKTNIEVSDDPSISGRRPHITDVSDVALGDHINKFYHPDKPLNEKNKIVYKAPVLLKPQPGKSKTNLFSKLSPLARKCLNDISPNIIQRKPTCEEYAVASLQRKRKMEAILDSDLDLIYQSDYKQPVFSTGVTINESTMGKEYLQEFDDIMRQIRTDTSSSTFNNLKYWLYLDNDRVCLNEEKLQNIQLLLKNILITPDISKHIPLENLILLLDILVQNIANSTSLTLSDDNSLTITKRIASISVHIIFTIFLLRRQEKEIYIEKYLLIPIQYISSSIADIRGNYSSRSIHPNLMLLAQSIQLLPIYIRQNTYLDDGVLAKLIYLFTDIITDHSTVFVSATSAQYSWNNIKTISLEALVSIFQRVPTQRMFLVNELLSTIDKLPTKRPQRILNRIIDGKYATYFSTCLLSMLESLNTLSIMPQVDNWTEDMIEQFTIKNKEQDKTLSSFIDHITETILKFFLQNTVKYRYIMETFVQDLIILFRIPTYFIASEVLSSILRKLLALFDSTSASSVTETSTLQIISLIGYAIFEVKCDTQPKQDNNIVKLYNYPDYIPQFINSLNRCLTFIKRNNGSPIAYEYFESKKFEKLLKLRDLNSDMENFSKITTCIDDTFRQASSKDISNGSHLSFKDINNDFCSILQSEDLIPQYESYFHILSTMLESNKIKLRSTALKSLSLLVSKDNTILSDVVVKSAISNVLMDSSAASVRDAVLDLINNGLCQVEYYKEINFSFDDDSILVRRHILKINEKIYDKCDDLEIATYVASHILLKTEDEEDSIIEAAKQILLKKWVLSFDEGEQRDESQIQLAKRIITVIASIIAIDKRHTEVFEWYLNFSLLDKDDHSPQEYSHIIKSLKIMTNTLVQEIIDIQSAESDSCESNKMIKSYLKLLSLFADATVSFITKDHISRLYPYMLSGEKSTLHYHILHVFNRCLQKSLNFKASFLESVETDLLRQLVKLNAEEIDEAVSIIWCTATQRGNKTRVIQACSSCLVHLNPYLVDAGKSAGAFEIDNKIQRLMYLLTAFARFCSFETHVDRLPFVDQNESLSEYVAKCLLVLSRTNIPHSLRRTSIRNLTKLCGTYPKLFHSRHILDLLKKELKGIALDIKAVILEGLLDFFTKEEDESLRQIGLAGTLQSNKKERKRTSFISHDDGVCSALSNRFIDNILEMCLIKESHDSVVAINLLRLIIKCGYINPSRCMAHAIGLLASDDKQIKQIAKDILIELLEKHESLVLNNIPKGITIAMDFSKVLYSAVYYRHDGFLRSLQDLIQDDKKSVSKFNRQLDKFFVSQVEATLSMDSTFNKMSSILFLSTNFVNLKFSSQGQFFSIIKALDFHEEQLRDNILDILKNEEEDDWNVTTLKMSIIIQYTLKELKIYLLNKFGFKETMLDSLLEGSYATEGKQMPSQLESSISFVDTVNNIVRQSNDKQVCNNYLREQQYVD